MFGQRIDAEHAVDHKTQDTRLAGNGNERNSNAIEPSLKSFYGGLDRLKQFRLLVEKIGRHGSDVGKPVVINRTKNFDGAFWDKVGSAACVEQIFEVAADSGLK